MTTDKTQGFHEAYRVLARSLLLRASGFQSCPTDLLDQLLADAEFVRLAAQEPLIRRGERVEHLMLVLEGVLHARISLGEGRSRCWPSCCPA
jgi:CRP-like cAMP-binding protein